MLEARVFVGVPLTPVLVSELSAVNPALRELLTSGGDEYLQALEHAGQTYLGKLVGESVELGRLELLQDNVLSLLQKLFPGQSIRAVALQVVGCEA